MSKSKKIIINEELCNGCGQCISPCVEGALVLVDGKARVVDEDLCDGAGVCLEECPTGALTLIPREGNTAQAQRITQQKDDSCSFCGIKDDEAYLLELKNNGQKIWVCTRCLPRLIHG